MGYIKYLEDIPLFNIDMRCVRALAERRKCAFNELSPLRQIIPSEISLHEGVDEDERLWHLTQVLSAPSFVSHFTKSGMSDQTETFSIYGSWVDLAANYVFLQEARDQKLMLLFDDVIELSTYIVSRYASMNTQSIQSVQGFDSDVSHFVFTLNVIDCIRRRYLTGLLNGKHIALEHITLQDYNEELDFNLKNSDVRWLLPSALRLIPRIHHFKFEMDPLNMELDPNYKLVTRYETESQGEVLFFLSDAIKKMGLDFTHHWKYALGFDIRSVRDTLGQYYLAPSDEINHFFELHAPNQCRYKPMGFNELLEKFSTIFESALYGSKE